MNRRSAIVILAAVALAGLSAALAVLLTGGGDNEAAPAHTMPGGEAMTEPMADAAHEGVVEGTVWVANEGSGSLTAIDAATNKVVTTLTGVEGPHNLQVSPDGRSVWAVSGHDSLALMVDGETYDLHGTVATGKEPAHIVLTLDGTKAYATNGADDTVTVIDVATMKQVATIPVGAFPHGLRPSPDGKWIYVANAKGTTVSVIDVASDRKVADIEVGEAPVQVGFAPDGNFAYVSLNAEDAVGKIDVAAQKLVGKATVGDGPIQVYVSPDGRYLVVANQGTEDAPSRTVSILATSTFEPVATLDSGAGAHGVVVDPSSRHAYITNIYGGDVSVIDLEERRVVARVPVGLEPNGISFSPFAPAYASALELPLPLFGEDEGEMPGMDMG